MLRAGGNVDEIDNRKAPGIVIPCSLEQHFFNLPSQKPGY